MLYFGHGWFVFITYDGSLPVFVFYSSTSKNDKIPVGIREFSG